MNRKTFLKRLLTGVAITPAISTILKGIEYEAPTAETIAKEFKVPTQTLGRVYHNEKHILDLIDPEIDISQEVIDISIRESPYYPEHMPGTVSVTIKADEVSLQCTIEEILNISKSKLGVYVFDKNNKSIIQSNAYITNWSYWVCIDGNTKMSIELICMGTMTTWQNL